MAERSVLREVEALLPPEQVRFLRRAGETARSLGMRLYLVGGPVRDLLWGRPVLDLDLVVEGEAEALAEALVRREGGRVRARSPFLTVKVDLPSVGPVDIATARAEDYPHPGALPRVRPASLREDLARRDFTLHAMAVDLDPSAFGRLVDPFDGEADLRAGLIRVLHDRSFVDDATRILRAVRYEQRLGFRIEPHTLALLQEGLPYLDTLSPDRVRHELERTLYEPLPERALARMEALGVLRAVHPTLRWTGEMGDAVAWARDQGLRLEPLLFLALMCAPLSREEVEGVARRLNLPTRWTRLARDASSLGSLLEALERPGLRPSEAVGLLKPYDQRALQAWALLARHRPAGGVLARYLEEWSRVRPPLRGDELIAMGVPPGPEVGRLLEALHSACLDGEVRGREEAEAWVRRRLAKREPGPTLGRRIPKPDRGGQR